MKPITYFSFGTNLKKLFLLTQLKEFSVFPQLAKISFTFIFIDDGIFLEYNSMWLVKLCVKDFLLIRNSIGLMKCLLLIILNIECE